MTSNVDKNTLHQMQKMANKLQDNPLYMAWVVSLFQKQEHITDYQLIELIKTDEESIAKLSLCKRPNSDSAEFAKQIKQISEYTNIDITFLANMIRQVESVESISKKLREPNKRSEETWQLGLAAARDRTADSDKGDSEDRDEDDLAQKQ
jgi:hypothetical protein